MALIVEVGAGAIDAESYLSVSDANAYHTKNGNSTWTGSDAVKEAALRRATRYLDGRYRSRFLGYRTFAFAQALEWPREAVLMNWLPGSADYAYWRGYSAGVGIILANNIIPQMLKDATAEAALRELVSPGYLTPDQTPSKRKLSQTIGPISTTYANDPMTRPVVTIIDEILAPLLTQTSALSGSLVRA